MLLRTCSVVVFALALASDGWCGDAKSEKPRLDAYGDPLPSGALARLGSARLRGQVLMFADDGKTLITVGADRALHYWDTTSGKELKRTQLAFVIGEGRYDFFGRGRSVNGHYCITADQETVRVWHTTTGREVYKTQNPELAKTVVLSTLSNDGKVATAWVQAPGQGFSVQVWDMASGKKLPTPPMAGGNVTPTISPDGKTLALTEREGRIRLYAAASGKELRQIKAQSENSAIHPPIFSPTSTKIAWIEGDDKEQKIRFWNIPDEKLEPALECADIGQVRGILFSADGRRLAVAGMKETVIWNLDARKEISRIATTGQRSPSAFSPDGRTLAVSTLYAAELYDVATGKKLLAVDGMHDIPTAIAFAPDGKRLVAGAIGDSTVRVWDTTSGKQVLALTNPLNTGTPMFSADGAHVLTGNVKGIIQFWDAKTGAAGRKFELNQEKNTKIEYAIGRLGTDGKKLAASAVGRGDIHTGQYVVWDLQTGKVQKRVDYYGFFQFFGNDGTLVRPIEQGMLVDVGTDRQIKLPTAEPIVPRLAAWSLSNRKLALKVDGGVSLLDLDSGRELARTLTGTVGDVELSRDGKTLVVVGRADLSVWEIASGKPVYRVPAPFPAGVKGAAFSRHARFSPDRSAVAVALSDATILILDIAPGFREGVKPDRKVLEKLWADLASDDAAAAYRAIWTLAGAPEDAIPFLKARLKPAGVDAKRIAALVADLGSATFAVRERAFQDLTKYDVEVEPALRRVLADRPTVEFRRRAEILLNVPRGIIHDREVLRGARAIQALEASGAPSARAVLESLATGHPDARLTLEAKASLARMK